MNKLVSILSLAFLTFTISAQEVVLMKGEAFDKNNKLVYIENHKYKKLPSGEITEIQTTYTDPDGKMFAEVNSTFSKDPFIPDTTFIDHRFNEKQELNFNKETNSVEMKITDTKTGKSKTNTIKRTPDMVSGQGFHNYILKHFDEAKADIKFIVLPKLDYYAFYFEKAASETPGQRQFALKISTWILRAIVKQITVEYRDRDHALLSFDGLTNIESNTRDSQILKIKMSYPGGSQ